VSCDDVSKKREEKRWTWTKKGNPVTLRGVRKRDKKKVRTGRGRY